MGTCTGTLIQCTNKKRVLSRLLASNGGFLPPDKLVAAYHLFMPDPYAHTSAMGKVFVSGDIVNEAVERGVKRRG